MMVMACGQARRMEAEKPRLVHLNAVPDGVFGSDPILQAEQSISL